MLGINTKKNMNAPFESEKISELKKNPLVNYLKIFQNQHRVVSMLYRGLIVSFFGFIILLSVLILTVFSNTLIPQWIKYVLVGIDALLLIGVVKAVIELGKYRKKSIGVLNQVYDYLKSDLAKFEKIKAEQQKVSESQKKLQDKVLSFSSKSGRPTVQNYNGWDSQTCPKCHATIEMLIETCPQCHHNLGKTFAS